MSGAQARPFGVKPDEKSVRLLSLAAQQRGCIQFRTIRSRVKPWRDTENRFNEIRPQ